MSNTRREFLQSSAALTIGMMGGAATSMAAESTAGTQSPQSVASPVPAAPVQVPKMKFGNAEIGRLVLGVNPMYGFSHYNNNFSTAMREWYTPDRVCEVLHRAGSYGINAFNYVHVDRAQSDWEKFQSQGGNMHLIIQVMARDDAAPLVQNFKPLALQRRGEEIDKAFQTGTMAAEREWCRRARDLGVLVGVGTHKPEVIELVEEQGWDIDFYSGCVYNRTRIRGRVEAGSQRRDHGNAPRHLYAERSGAHVQGHAPNLKDLLRLQDSGRRAHRRRRRRRSLPHGVSPASNRTTASM